MNATSSACRSPSTSSVQRARTSSVSFLKQVNRSIHLVALGGGVFHSALVRYSFWGSWRPSHHLSQRRRCSHVSASVNGRKLELLDYGRCELTGPLGFGADGLGQLRNVVQVVFRIRYVFVESRHGLSCSGRISADAAATSFNRRSPSVRAVGVTSLASTLRLRRGAARSRSTSPNTEYGERERAPNGKWTATDVLRQTTANGR